MGAPRSGRRGERIDAVHNIAGLQVDGDVELGTGESQVVTVNGRCSVRHVDDGGMNATPGTAGELVFNRADSRIYACSVGDPAAATWVHQQLAGTLEVTGDVTASTTADVGVLMECGADLDVGGDMTVEATSTLNVLGNVTFGDAATDTVTVTGTFFPRRLPSDPATTHPSGTVGELAYFSGKLYVCTDATVGAEVWESLN